MCFLLILFCAPMSVACPCCLEQFILCVPCTKYAKPCLPNFSLIHIKNSRQFDTAGNVSKDYQILKHSCANIMWHVSLFGIPHHLQVTRKTPLFCDVVLIFCLLCYIIYLKYSQAGSERPAVVCISRCGYLINGLNRNNQLSFFIFFVVFFDGFFQSFPKFFNGLSFVCQFLNKIEKKKTNISKSSQIKKLVAQYAHIKLMILQKKS